MKNEILITEMIKYEHNVPHRAGHFLKVYGFAKAIAEMENLSLELCEIIETAAIVHDIGIRPSLEKYQSSAGNYQQLEGPPKARKLLNRLGYSDNLIDRVCYLVAHHHTYTNIDGIDYQILVEADFLVNIFEDSMKKDAIINIRDKCFKTQTGILYLNTLYLGENDE